VGTAVDFAGTCFDVQWPVRDAGGGNEFLDVREVIAGHKGNSAHTEAVGLDPLKGEVFEAGFSAVCSDPGLGFRSLLSTGPGLVKEKERTGWVGAAPFHAVGHRQRSVSETRQLPISKG
jgi:hypothetical protein